MSTTSKKSTPKKTAAKPRSRATKATTATKAPAKTTAAKTRASKKATTPSKAAKTAAPTTPSKAKAPAAQKAKPTVVNAPTPVVVGPAMRKKELIDAVVQRTGMKKKDVKPVVESMLGVLGDALAEGRELVAQPMGKLRVHKQKTTARKRILFAKLHQNLPPVAGTDAAPAADKDPIT